VLRRRKTRPSSASSWDGLYFSKGPTTRQRKQSARAKAAAWLKAVREKVFARDRACRACHGGRRNWLHDQMHELRSRAHTRGLPPEERFNTKNCVRLCADCHTDVTERRLWIYATTEDGADGYLEVSYQKPPE
jgi:hypothetical protein